MCCKFVALCHNRNVNVPSLDMKFLNYILIFNDLLNFHGVKLYICIVVSLDEQYACLLPTISHGFFSL